MKIDKLYINNFRLFKEKEFIIGKYITAISGLNATGKSTLLTLLGHCAEYKKGKPILKPSFKADLGEIIKFSEDYDIKLPLIGKLFFTDMQQNSLEKFPSEISYRSTWQKSPFPRYRILPKRTPTRNSDAKITWPTLYLGLSRLYPVGESGGINKIKIINLSNEEKQFIFDNYRYILHSTDTPCDYTALSMEDTTKKKTIGISTDKYDYLCNSAGQDNLGQIIMAILSFKKLKDALSINWNGGLLLIDELDSTLHPRSQNNLVDFLFKQAKILDIQIVFTTHSLSLLEYICAKIENNNPIISNNYELIYITSANRDIQVFQNPSYEIIYNGLMVSYNYTNFRKISVFTEDKEARYFISKILEQYLHRIKLLEANLGNDQLLDLLSADYNNFSQYLFVLDGDTQQVKINKCAEKIQPKHLFNLLTLPGSKRPEEIIWDYLKSLPPDHHYLDNSHLTGRTILAIEEVGPYSSKYAGEDSERRKFKRWFNDNIQLIDDAIPFWMDDNNEIIRDFQKRFINAFNMVASYNHLPKIVYGQD